MALRKRLDATRQALAAVEEVEAVAAWLAGAAEGSVRPFSGGRPFQGPPVGASRERFSAGQLLDGLVAIVDLLDQPAEPRSVAQSLRVTELRRAG